jgi:hypothetical protein
MATVDFYLLETWDRESATLFLEKCLVANVNLTFAIQPVRVG